MRVLAVTNMYPGVSTPRAGTFVDSRSRPSALFTVLNFGNNFHLAHHLYPSVPCYRLGKVHRLLESQGYLARAGSPVDRSVREVLSRAVGPYPAASREAGPEMDPRELAPAVSPE